MMRREEQRDARLREAGEHVVDAVAALRIDADRRLVEEHDPRTVQHAARDVQPPPHAARELFDRLPCAIGKARLLERPVDLLGQVRTRKAVQRAEDFEVLARREERIERDLLRHDPELGRRPAPVRNPIEGPDLPAVETHAPGDRANERRLAGAVRTEQRQQLSLPQLEARAVERHGGAELLPGVDHREDVHEFILALAGFRTSNFEGL